MSFIGGLLRTTATFFSGGGGGIDGGISRRLPFGSPLQSPDEEDETESSDESGTESDAGHVAEGSGSGGNATSRHGAHRCFCPCGGPGWRYKLSTISSVRHQQLSALGFTSTMQVDLKDKFKESWRGGVLAKRDFDLLHPPLGPFFPTPGKVWHQGFMADKHFEGYVKVQGEPKIPTMFFDLSTGEWRPVERLVTSTGERRVPTPRTPRISPATQELAKLTDFKRRRGMSGNELMESGEKVALYVHSLEEKIFNLEQRNKVLEELLAKLKRDNSVPLWQTHPSGGLPPTLKKQINELTFSIFCGPAQGLLRRRKAPPLRGQGRGSGHTGVEAVGSPGGVFLSTPYGTKPGSVLRGYKLLAGILNI